MLLFIFFLLVKRNIVRDQCAAFLICLLAEYLGINADTWSVVHIEKSDYIKLKILRNMERVNSKTKVEGSTRFFTLLWRHRIGLFRNS